MMQILESRLVRTVLLVCVPLLFIPKINLLAIAGSNAGIRVDDLILLLIALLFFVACVVNRHPLGKIEWVVFSITLTALLSCFLNLLWKRVGRIEMVANPLYAVRLAEYSTFFFVGWVAFRFTRATRVAGGVMGLNLCVMVLQICGLLGAFFVTGYVSDIDGRAMGLCAHGNEMGLLLNICAVYLIYTLPPKRLALVGRYRHIVLDSRLLLLGIALLFMILTGSRIGLIGLLVVAAALVREMGLLRHPLTLAVTVMTASAALLLLLVGGERLDLIYRSQHLFSAENLLMIPEAYQMIDIEEMTFLDAASVDLSEGGYDTSWLMRLYKWLFILKYYLHHPESWLLGIGPGVCGSCLDGSYLRILTENGLVGLSLYLYLFLSIGRTGRAMRFVVATYLINMIFIDSYISYKPMIMLLFLTGYELAWKREKSEGSRGSLAEGPRDRLQRRKL